MKADSDKAWQCGGVLYKAVLVSWFPQISCFQEFFLTKLSRNFFGIGEKEKTDIFF